MGYFSTVFKSLMSLDNMNCFLESFWNIQSGKKKKKVTGYHQFVFASREKQVAFLPWQHGS